MYRFLSVEMSLPRDERMKPKDLLKYVRNEYERLNEISPLIPGNLIKIFNVKFANEKEISQPEEVNGLEKITVYTPAAEAASLAMKMYEEPSEENTEEKEEEVKDDKFTITIPKITPKKMPIWK
jgi:hypothetical protein